MTGDSDMKSNTQDDDVYIDVEQYRKLVRNFIDMRRYQTALFWAEKVVNLSQNEPNDVYWEAQCMFLLGEYHRAAHVIRSNGLEKTHLLCYYLALECLYEAKEYEDAVRLLNDIEADDVSSLTVTGKCSDISNPFQSGIDENTKNEVLASINHLKGKIFEAMDNRVRAMDHYVAALQKSVFCTESLDALVQHEMLMAWEEKELMDHLPFSQQCTEAEAKMIKKLYESKLKKYYNSLKPLSNSQQTPISSFQLPKDLAERMKNNGSTNEVKIDKTINSTLFTPMAPNILSPANNPSYSLQSSLSKNNMTSDSNRTSHSIHKIKINLDCPTAISLSNCMSRIQMSVDILASDAEKLFYDCEYTKCLKVLDTLFKKDPYHNKGLTVQIGCLVELKEFNKLFYVAHKLVDRYPDKAISWYAVGCYYDLIGKSDPARRYLSKATSLDRLFGPAWLAFGHSFAKENEHDQAMAAYFKATQLMRGCHLPLLYIGVECGLTKNFELAEKFFYQAMSIAPLDVVVLHELGAIKFEYEYYESAEEIFRITAEIVTSRARKRREAISPRWEPLFNNLGHCCRKNKKYKEALEYHQMALVLKPQNSETYTAIGFVYALMGRLEDAIEAFHKSLSLNRDSSVTLTILNTCIEDLMEEFPMLDDVPPKGPIEAPKIQPKRNNQTEEKPMKYNCVKLKFDDFDASPTSDTVDMSCDMSVDM